jgi:hypothetical protein
MYGLEESWGMTALVMELVEGEDLWQRIAAGAIPLDEVLHVSPDTVKHHWRLRKLWLLRELLGVGW